MRIHQDTLANDLASLRHAVASSPKGAWMPAPVHALVIAILTRIFARLEQIFHQWQAGCLPRPANPANPAPV